MKIGIDIDGVLTDVEEFCFEHGSKYALELGKDLDEIKYDEYHTSDIFNWSQETDKDFWGKVFADYIENEKPRAFAKEIIEKLYKNEENEIYFITARNNERFGEDVLPVEKMTVKWLQKNEIPYHKIFFDSKDKRDIILENKVDVMIEDNPKNIECIHDCTNVIVYDAIYNRNVSGNRAFSWYQIYDKIQKIKNNK